MSRQLNCAVNTKSTVLALLASCPLLVLVREELPPRVSANDMIDARAELKRLGSMEGAWTGTLRPTFDPVGAYREWPQGFPVRIELKGDDVALWFIEKGFVSRTVHNLNVKKNFPWRVFPTYSVTDLTRVR